MGGVENTTSCSRLFASARFTPKLSVVVSHCLLKSARKGARSKLGKKEITEEQYEKFIEKEIEEMIKFQEEVGLDVFVHGEPERNDMVLNHKRPTNNRFNISVKN